MHCIHCMPNLSLIIRNTLYHKVGILLQEFTLHAVDKFCVLSFMLLLF